MLQCIQAPSQTTPEKLVSNPWHGKGFCEPNQYKSAISRCEGGLHSCELNLEILGDLASILDGTAKALRQWSTSSYKLITRSAEFGTTKQAWMNSVLAVERLAQRHQNMHENIKRTVIEKAETYKNENYAKSMMKVRKVHEFEKDFKKAQKSWLELMDGVNDAKDAFHTAKRKFIIAEKQGRLIDTDVSSSEERKSKSKDSIAAREKESKRQQTKYEDALKKLSAAEPGYVKRMHEILESTDEFEVKRMQHFATLFTALQKALSLDDDKCHDEMAAKFKAAIESQKIPDDIDYFHTHYGKKPANNWPVFEDVKE